MVHFNVTEHPSAEWMALQIVQAFPWEHLSLEKDAPEPRAIEPPEMGEVIALPQVGGLHHRYGRRAA